jgi:hypothetical protein
MTRLLAIASCALLAACAGVQQRQPAPKAAPAVTVAPAPPSGEPGDLAGLGSTQLRVVFGAPAFVRKEGTMELWRYDSASCRAFFFLYPYGSSLLVRHVETLPRGLDMAADEACLEALRTRSPAPVS